jgi:replicative DNA helicase
MDRREDRRTERGGSARRTNRVPPHNLPAEESVLGALLLSREAIGAVSEAGLRPEDFYKPGHQHIFDAIRALYSSGAPVDTITVSDELRRAGLLDQVGGTEALHSLQNATPAISNAAHYARIVQDTAILRRLIHVAGDIAEMAYGEPDDVTKAVDEAESRVFKVAEERVAVDSTQLLSESIKGVMDRLEETFARGDIITGTATGYHDVDELLSGLQPSTLNIVGARPAMGKCVAWDTPIVDTATGELITALELLERTAARGRTTVRALGVDGRQHEARVSTCIDDGVKPVFTVHTWSGRRVTITAAHPLLTAHGWRRLGEIATGELIAVPTNLPVFGTRELPVVELDRVAQHTALAPDGSQRLAPPVFTLRRPLLARFLNRLLGFGGRACVSQCGLPRVEYTAGSEQLGRDVFHVLVRFGIRAKLRERLTGYNRGQRREFEIAIVDPRSLLRFCDEIGIAGQEHAVAHVRTVAAAAIPGCITDCVPAEAWSDVLKALEAAGDPSWAEVNRRCGRPLTHSWHVGGGRLSREDVAELAEALDDDQLRWWASPDVEWDRVVAIVPAGTTRVVDFSVPRLHNFVAADVYLHNTAFGLGMATHVAQNTGRPVLVFSLEMGHNELTQRILASEARVDSMKMRNGRLSESDWAKIGRAIGRLEVPLFLDDNPRVTVMEIRAKARRLKARHGGLALVVVDYLQLMSGGGTAENRQLEVSEISRNLKILARELDVPIVALSQLSRNLESRSDKRPMLSDLRESGCLTAATRLVRADTGHEVTLGELVHDDVRDIPVWSLDERYRLVPGQLVRAFPSGVKDVYRLRLASGRCVDASANHPFLTVEGWKRVDSLVVGDRIAATDRCGGAPPTSRTLGDVIPGAVWEHVRRKSLPAVGATERQLAVSLELLYRRHARQRTGVSRELLRRLAAVTDDVWLSDLANADVAWDRIVEIAPLGPQPVYDATVEPTHNFIANGIVAHNSLEQDADVVMFLYRDEVYNNESPDKGAAEVIIAKHRSGPIGTRRLVFLGQYTRFDNAARSV